MGRYEKTLHSMKGDDMLNRYPEVEVCKEILERTTPCRLCGHSNVVVGLSLFLIDLGSYHILKLLEVENEVHYSGNFDSIHASLFTEGCGESSFLVKNGKWSCVIHIEYFSRKLT